MPLPRRIFGLSTALMMALVAVWCCCQSAPAADAPTQACCAVTPDEGPKCPGPDAPADGCPVLKLREQMPTVSPTVLATPIDLATPLADWLVPAVLLPQPVAFPPQQTAAPATGPPTLLNLHTSLLW